MAISGNYSRDLWNLALATLKIDDKQQLNFGLPSQRIIEDVLIVVEEKRNVCMQKRWKYKKANGDVLILRDIFEKIVTWVSKFKEVGDAAVQYDPSHAALPWAAVRFFLQVGTLPLRRFVAREDFCVYLLLFRSLGNPFVLGPLLFIEVLFFLVVE